METPPGPEDVANFVFTTGARPWRHRLKTFVCQNRRHPTPAEDRLWQGLRNSKLGPRFRRQHAVGGFIADFICVRAFLTIELDGENSPHPRAGRIRCRPYLHANGIRPPRTAFHQSTSAKPLRGSHG